MASAKPLWRRAVDGAERRLAGPLEGVVHHEITSLALSIGSRAIAEVRSQADRASRAVLHAMNMPAVSDMNRLLEHVSKVEHEICELRAAKQSDRFERAPRRPRALPRTEDEA